MKQFLQGMKDGSAIGIGYFSVSFTFGIAAVASGLNCWEALLVSMMNLTSAGQFAGITVMAAAGSYLEMAVSQFVINLRYALMSISLSQKADADFTVGKKLILGFANTDEIFAVAISREQEVSSQYYFGLAVLPYIGWTLGTLTGAVLGNILPPSVCAALGLAIYAMFIAIVVPVIKADSSILKIVVLAIFLSCCLYYIPGLNKISSGFSIIICAVVASLVGAALFPIEEKEEVGR
ncbi:MAG: AzlC family ABC transporter permease [Lachnospiraceae bacterium]